MVSQIKPVGCPVALSTEGFPEVDDWGLWLQREDDELVAEIHARRAPRILARVRCAS